FASEVRARVAVPLIAPAFAVLIPTCRCVESVLPGASRLTLPFAVIGLLPAIVASSAACGAVVAMLVRLTKPTGDVAPTRTLPRLIGELLITGSAWLMTFAVIVPSTP